MLSADLTKSLPLTPDLPCGHVLVVLDDDDDDAAAHVAVVVMAQPFPPIYS